MNKSGRAETTASGSGIDPGLVGALVRSILDGPQTRHLRGARVPSTVEVAELTEQLRELMFPGFFTRRGLTEENLHLHVQELVSRIQLSVEEQVRNVLRYHSDVEVSSADASEDAECDRRAHEIAARFMGQLPAIRGLLALDVQAAYKGDPAATHTDETILCYPGVDAIFTHRMAHALYELGVPLLPRIMQELAHKRTGIDVHPGAQVGKSFFIDHGAGVVVGQTTIIGDEVRIYKGVKIGATSFELDKGGQLKRTGDTKRHPTIGNRVTIYAGAVILGGETVIGDDCVIAGSALVMESVPAGHLVRLEKPNLIRREMAEVPRRG